MFLCHELWFSLCWTVCSRASPPLLWVVPCYVTYVCNVSSNKMDYPYRPPVFWLAVTHCGFGLHYATPQETVCYLHVCQAQLNPFTWSLTLYYCVYRCDCKCSFYKLSQKHTMCYCTSGVLVHQSKSKTDNEKMNRCSSFNYKYKKLSSFLITVLHLFCPLPPIRLYVTSPPLPCDLWIPVDLLPSPLRSDCHLWR